MHKGCCLLNKILFSLRVLQNAQRSFAMAAYQAEIQTNGKTSIEKRMAGQRLEIMARVQEQGGHQVCWHSGAIYQVYG